MKRISLGILVLIAAAFVVSLAAPAFSADKIIIGVPTSLTFIEGEESLNSVKLAVGEINAAGGVDVGGTKMPLEVESIDIRDAAPGVPVPEALLGIEKIILEKKVNAIVVGPFRSEALMAAMDIISKYKVPTLGTIAMSPKSEEKVMSDPEKYKYIFRVCLNGKYLVGYLAGSMKFLEDEFGFKKVFVMNQDVAWARGVADGMVKTFFEKQGWEVLGHETFPTGTSDFSAALMKAKAMKAQAILTIFDMPQGGILVKQWNSMKIPALLTGFISPATGPSGWKTFDGKIGGMLNAVYELGDMPSEKYLPAKKFYDAYEKKYGKQVEAGHGPAPSYESVYLLKDAIEKAGSLDPDKIVTALKQTDREGVMGHIKFNEGNQVIYGMDPAKEALACVFQWTEDGKRVIVYPPSIAEAKIKLPASMKSAKKK